MGAVLAGRPLAPRVRQAHADSQSQRLRLRQAPRPAQAAAGGPGRPVAGPAGPAGAQPTQRRAQALPCALDAWLQQQGARGLLEAAQAGLQHWRRGLAGALAAALLCLAPLAAQAAAPVLQAGLQQPAVHETQSGGAEDDALVIHFKASRDPAIREVQEALVQAWGYVSTQFLDTSFNQVDWPAELQSGIDKSFEAEQPEDVYKVIDGMLGKLGDPFTRVIPPATAGDFEDMTEGRVVSLGFQATPDEAGLLRVALVADGSPAQLAGMQVGDRLVAINGRDPAALSRRELAAMLRSEAEVRLERGGQALSLHVKARRVETHPVQYAVLSSRGEAPERKAGYIRLSSFSRNAARDVAAALQTLKGEEVSSVVLDLRDNAGGIVFSGYEVAQLFLPEGADFCFVEDGRGASEDVKLTDSHMLTDKPMSVLVNRRTASTAELIAASLRDNHRAALVGERTFGKGRTQRIVPLRGGGLLLLSNTLYLTPQHRPVDKVGLAPDFACKPEAMVRSNARGTKSLLEDSCIQLAVELSQFSAP